MPESQIKRTECKIELCGIFIEVTEWCSYMIKKNIIGGYHFIISSEPTVHGETVKRNYPTRRKNQCIFGRVLSTFNHNLHKSWLCGKVLKDFTVSRKAQHHLEFIKFKTKSFVIKAVDPQSDMYKYVKGCKFLPLPDKEHPRKQNIDRR